MGTIFMPVYMVEIPILPRLGDLIGHAGATNTVYLDVHDHSGTLSHYGGDLYATTNSYWGSPSVDFQIVRTFLGFDTRPINVTRAIIAGKIRIMVRTGTAPQETDSGHTTVHVVEGIQSDPIVDSDYGAHKDKTTSGGSIPFSSVDGKAGQYVEIPLNSDGLEWINKGGITKFCLRLAGDISALEPTGRNRVWWHTQDPGKEVKLVLKYANLGGD